jgi:WXG100 family type VII secretion target
VATTVIVGADKLRAAAAQLENLRNEAEGTLTNYLNASHDIASGGWKGDASMANVVTAEEIHNAQMKLNTQWGELIHALQAAATKYEEQEAAARAAMQGVSQSM